MVTRSGLSGLQKFDRAALVASYVLLVLSVVSIGFIVESNATQTQARVCASLAAEIEVNVELTLYVRALYEDAPDVQDLKPTVRGQALADDIRQRYEEVCGGHLPES